MENRIKTKGTFKRKFTGLSKMRNDENVESEAMILGEAYWYLECCMDNNRLWFFLQSAQTLGEGDDGAVIAEFSIRILSQNPEVEDIVKDHLNTRESFFTSSDYCAVDLYDINVADLSTNAYIVNDEIEFQASFEVTNVAYMGCFGINFLKPTKHSDAVLVVGERKLHVNKKFLATHSSFFEKMFENSGTNDEFEMPSDATFAKICELLRFIYSDSGLFISYWNTIAMMELADEYDVPEIMHMFVENAISIDHDFSYNTFRALKIADKHKLTNLHSHLLKSSSKKEIRSLSTEDGFENLSVESKNAIARVINSWETPKESSEQLQCSLDDELIPASKKLSDEDVLRQGTIIKTLMPATTSDQFYIGNIPWTIEVQEKSDKESMKKYFEMHLSGNTGNISPFWSINANLTIRIVCQSEEEEDLVATGEFCFDSEHGRCRIRFAAIDNFANFKSENGIKTEISIKIVQVVGIACYSIDFSKPTDLSDVALIVEGKKIYVNKEYMAIHSTVFDRMFFSGFKESNQEEVKLKNMDYESFVDIMTLIYPGAGVPVHEDNWASILQISDFYDIQKVRKICEKYLTSTKKISDWDKFEIFEKYNLDKNQILKSWNTRDIERLKDSKEFENLSIDTCRKLIERSLKIDFRARNE